MEHQFELHRVAGARSGKKERTACMRKSESHEGEPPGTPSWFLRVATML